MFYHKERPRNSRKIPYKGIESVVEKLLAAAARGAIPYKGIESFVCLPPVKAENLPFKSHIRE